MSCFVACQLILSKPGGKQGVRKSTFFIYRDFFNGNLLQKWAWLTPHNLVEFTEHADIRIKNVQHNMMEFWTKKNFKLKIALPAGRFWCVSYRGHTVPPQ